MPGRPRVTRMGHRLRHSGMDGGNWRVVSWGGKRSSDEGICDTYSIVSPATLVGGLALQEEVSSEYNIKSSFRLLPITLPTLRQSSSGIGRPSHGVGCFRILLFRHFADGGG